jgi:small subunit ribosomal protein S16
MLVVRLRKAGSKKRPFFRVVVTDSRTARDSSFVEIVGHYNPRTKPAAVTIDRERINYWVGKGAQMSDTVRTLLARHVTAVPSAPDASAVPASADRPSAAAAS